MSRSVEGRVERPHDLGQLAHRLRRLRHDAAVERGVVAAAGPHLEALRPRAGRSREAHLDLAELPVAHEVGRRVAEQVVGPGLARDPRHPAREVVRVLDREAAGVERDVLRAFGVARDVGEHRHGVLRIDRSPELRGEGSGQRLQAARVYEVDGHVHAARRVDHVPELVELGVVDEALGDEDHRLAPADPGERADRALHDFERDLVAAGGQAVGELGAVAHDERRHPVLVGAYVGRGRAAVVRLLAVHRVRVEAAHHLPRDVLVFVHHDPHCLVLADAVGRGVGHVAAVEALHDREQTVAALRYACLPPGAAGGSHEDHRVALRDRVLQERDDRRLGPEGLRGREVDVVEEEHERPTGRDGALVRRVGRPRRGLARFPGRLSGRLERHRLEARDHLRLAAVDQHEVVLREAGDGLPLLVHDDGVDRDELDLRRKRWLRLGGLGKGRCRSWSRCGRWSRRTYRGRRRTLSRALRRGGNCRQQADQGERGPAVLH